MKVFLEEQKFTQKWLYVGLAAVLIITIGAIIKDWNRIINGTTIGLIVTFSSVLIVVLICVLFLYLKLSTRIDEYGIHVKFFPIPFSGKTIYWNELSNCYIRTYNAISEYGGWGVKFSLFKKKGKSFTVKGTTGLQLELKNGRKFLIGTQQKEAIELIIRRYEYKTNLK